MMKQKKTAETIEPGQFFSRLKMVRKTLGFTQDTFCARTKVSKPTLVRYECGDRKPSSDFLALLANEFNIDMNWLITGKGEMFSRDLSEIGILVNREDKELCELIDLLSIPQMRRSVMAEFDQLKIIFKSLVDEHYTGKRKVLNE
ncbi:MAG: helix-turn-helix transcriptional regulator [bacterium]|nr:helix-turn-helix transcriptional regulator [bacterium]